ncbi:thioredoxin-like protein [Colletotrichum incanum]|uniref:Thioredoxin-like protein n=1 Tax=Colletotrichum incanum TaxID=1573173 RepID=A0A162MYZ6_COLIC|nr:thioredoxin-like protein [Colletotrichum incanum]OHW97291.1 thioredoxin-like protein [Colletotrichum incanum]
MDWLSYIFLAFAIFMIGRALLADRSPIPETSGKVYKLSSAAELDALLASTTHVVVDFYADWCPPCRAIAPVFSELADKHASDGRLAFAKVNVDHVNAVAGRYNVSAMPTFVFFHDGKPQGVKVQGLKPRQSVSFTGEGLVDRVRGADRAALQAVVQALAGQGGEDAKKE